MHERILHYQTQQNRKLYRRFMIIFGMLALVGFLIASSWLFKFLSNKRQVIAAQNGVLSRQSSTTQLVLVKSPAQSVSSSAPNLVIYGDVSILSNSEWGAFCAAAGLEGSDPIFAGSLQRADGTYRVVAIQEVATGKGPRNNFVWFAAQILEKASVLAPVRFISQQKAGVLVYKGNTLKIFAGQKIPGNPAQVVLVYETESEKGTVEFELKANDKVTMHVSGGAGADESNLRSKRERDDDAEE